MDSNQNRITSTAEFRDELKAVLARARDNLVRDDSLASIALLSGSSKQRQLMFVNVSGDVAQARLKQEVLHGNYETVIYVTLAAAMESKLSPAAETIYRAMGSLVDFGSLEGSSLCVMVEGTHRDFGNHAAHTLFKREGEKQFVFGESACGVHTGCGVITDLWPNRKLNS